MRKWSQKQYNNINNAASGNNKNHFNDDASVGKVRTVHETGQAGAVQEGVHEGWISP